MSNGLCQIPKPVTNHANQLRTSHCLSSILFRQPEIEKWNIVFCHPTGCRSFLVSSKCSAGQHLFQRKDTEGGRGIHGRRGGISRRGAYLSRRQERGSAGKSLSEHAENLSRGKDGHSRSYRQSFALSTRCFPMAF